MADPLMDQLAALEPAAPDPARSERTRLRGHAHLARQSPTTAPARAARDRPAVWPSAVAMLGVLYMLQALVMAFRLYTAR